MESPKSSEMEMEIEEAHKLKEIQNILAKTLELPAAKAKKTLKEQKETDARSVFIGNVDWFSTTEQIVQHLAGCESIVRVTIPKDKRTQRQKNFAYVEFDSEESVQMALVMDGSVFRPIVVSAKRTNIPGMSARGAPRGGAHGRQAGHSQVLVKFVYIKTPAREGQVAPKGKRFTPY